MKEIADDNFKFDENGRKFCKWVENSVGTGGITHLTLSQMKKKRLFKTERDCKRQFHCSNWQEVLQMGRKHCVKWKNCSLRAISPFPTVLKKMFCGHVKNPGLVLERVNRLSFPT